MPSGQVLRIIVTALEALLNFGLDPFERAFIFSGLRAHALSFRLFL